ncbi:MAG: hydroxymethylglutaryl-CoA synthase [Methanobacteriota archaeon]|jgi:hydroxymethylglutaryl-CoA synthase|uniref:Hydroxymethylglutaryl-CoA synthase n=1 Tax=Halorutilus salinus TaxID=2487751 RepID=A0A9Q4C5I4_9EURY|nr:hydroxymethylglutaryl-CoA synthase [Halorutilus salinus]MCX2818671.1 hydroxymethylglutaryl-CoA synthase [Halorutilus salinus]
MGAGIVSYGGYVPRYRIRTEEIARVWGDDADAVEGGLRVGSKSVPDEDEDTATISVEAARRALDRTSVDGDGIGAIYVGSESHPYAVKPTATIVGAAVGATPLMTAADMEFACKAGTAGIQAVLGLVESGRIDNGMAIGADVSQGAPGDALEYSAAAGGAAFVVGDENVVAEIEDTISYTSDTPDFWRREGERYPQHGERFTGKPAYFKHTEGASNELLDRLDASPDDYDHAVFHQPNGKFPARVAESLGFDEEQYATGLLAPDIGNTYSGASLLGLVAVLDEAEAGERIFFVSFGSGAGSDAFSLTVRDGIEEKRTGLRETLEDVEYVDYAQYAKHKGKIKDE